MQQKKKSGAAQQTTAVEVVQSAVSSGLNRREITDTHTHTNIYTVHAHKILFTAALVCLHLDVLNNRQQTQNCSR